MIYKTSSPRTKTVKNLYWSLLLTLTLSFFSNAFGSNILIIGPRSSQNGKGIKTELERILIKHGAKDHKVAVTGPSEPDQTLLSGWVHDPDHDAKSRWNNLKGGAGTAWDYVVIMESPKVIETFPGWYAQGVHDVAKEVERGKGEAVLMMQWPSAKSKATLDYYKEVSYRVGRGRDLRVVPAGLAWADAGKPRGKDADYLAAATLFSLLYNKPAPSERDSEKKLATVGYKAVKANLGTTHTPGPFSLSPTGIHSIKGEQKRVIRMINDGHFSRGLPMEVRINGQIWRLVREAGLIEDITSFERGMRGKMPKTIPSGPSDLVYREYPPEKPPRDSSIRDANSALYLLYSWSHLVKFTRQEQTVNTVKWEYNIHAPFLDSLWRKGDRRLRQVPNSLLLAQYYRHFQTRDEEGMEGYSKQIMAAYLFTMLTGRCPMVPGDEGNKSYVMQQLGYEAAWRFSTLHGRAPGFRSWPAERLRMTVDPKNDVVLEVAFLLPPKKNVTVKVTTTNPNARVTPVELTFTPSNHKVPQKVSLSVDQNTPPQTAFDVTFSTRSKDVVYDRLTQSWSYKVNSKPLAHPQKNIIAYTGRKRLIKLSGDDPDREDLKFSPYLQPITYEITSNPSKGKLSLHGRDVIYIPNAGASGQDRFGFKTKDFSRHSDEALVEIDIQQPPLYNFNLLTNGSAEFFPFSKTHWVEKKGTWGQKRSKIDGTYAFYSSKSPNTAELYQDVDVNRYAARTDQGDQTFRFTGYIDDVKGTWDDVRVILIYFDKSMTTLGVNDSGDLNVENAKKEYACEFQAAKGTRTIRVLLRAKDGPDKGGSPNTAIYDKLGLVALRPRGPAK